MVRRAKDKKKRDTEARPPPERGQSLRKINQKPSPSPPKGTHCYFFNTHPGQPPAKGAQGPRGWVCARASLVPRCPPSASSRCVLGSSWLGALTHDCGLREPSRAGGGWGFSLFERPRAFRPLLVFLPFSAFGGPLPPPALVGFPLAAPWVLRSLPRGPCARCRLVSPGGRRVPSAAVLAPAPVPCTSLGWGLPRVSVESSKESPWGGLGLVFG